MISSDLCSQLSVLFVALLLCKLAYAAETDSVVEFDYSDGPNGPHNWGHLTPEWELCTTGKWQSPVNVNKKELKDEGYTLEWKANYKSGAAVLQTREHDVAVDWKEDGGTLELAGVHYTLQHLHLHSPSEHTINGVRFPLEMHMVHEGPDGKLAVVSVLYKYGKEDKFLAQVMEKFPHVIENQLTEIDIGNVDVSSMKLGKRYYHYTGSLTTPPCTEGVTWIILKKKRNVATEQVKAIIEAELGENSRPLQPLNGRHVYKY